LQIKKEEAAAKLQAARVSLARGEAGVGVLYCGVVGGGGGGRRLAWFILTSNLI